MNHWTCTLTTHEIELTFDRIYNNLEAAKKGLPEQRIARKDFEALLEIVHNMYCRFAHAVAEEGCDGSAYWPY